MKKTRIVSLVILSLISFAGCKESEFGNEVYTFSYVEENDEFFKKLSDFCEKNNNSKLDAIQMQNCETAKRVKDKNNLLGGGTKKEREMQLQEDSKKIQEKINHAIKENKKGGVSW